MTQRIILLTSLTGQPLSRLVRAFGASVAVEPIYDASALSKTQVDPDTSLISFGSGVIVPRELLARLQMPAYNLHAASPEFPGRDPHHHAIYRGASDFGATLHIMTAEVDAGPIVAVERFPVAEGLRPGELLAQANEAGMQLIERFGARLLWREPLPALPDTTWGKVKTRRSDLHRLSALSPLITEDEFRRRYSAFDGGAHDNLTVALHGQTFRIDKRPRPHSSTPAEFEDFTENGFRKLLRAAKGHGYQFVRYGEEKSDPHLLWRHDVDFSMHRAARLAEIEAEEGVVATYFLNARCVFYNLIEPQIARLAARIRSLGHDIGLHFDASAYESAHWTQAGLERALRREQTLLETILEAPVASVSWHNPDLSNLLDFDSDLVGGLINAYSSRLKRDYAYCSDSNGYWRFKPMMDVIAAGHPRLHLLTHPEWWTPQPMAATARLDRAILGRAQAARAFHDALITFAGRKNGGS